MSDLGSLMISNPAHLHTDALYVYEDSKLLPTVVYFGKPVKNSLWAVSDEQQALNFCPPDQPGRKLMYHYVHRRRYELTVLIICCAKTP